MINKDYQGYTLLVAEDNETNFAFIQACFRATGLRILHAKNGDETVAFCRSEPDIGLIIMDGQMPIKSGFEAAVEIHAFRPELPIILVTAYVSYASGRLAIESGCNDYLAKPISCASLKSALEKWIIKK